MNRKWILGSVTVGCIVAAFACGGSTSSTGGGPDSGAGSSSGGGSGSSSGTGADSGSSSGGGSGSSSGGGSGSSSGANDGGTVVVEGGTFPCGQAVCNPPDVCCTTAGGGGGGGAMQTCESQSSCHGVAESCTADTCPSGALCCGTLMIGTGGVSGSTECVVGTKCPTGTDQLCSGTSPCPTGDRCVALGAGGGGGGGGGTDICRPEGDGGNFPHPDGGTSVPDAGAE